MENTPIITQEELELMERFWQGSFAGQEEEQRLREKYATDSVWRNKADSVRLLMLGIQETALEDRMENFYQQATRSVRNISWVKWGIAACLTAAIIIGGLLFYSRSPEEKLFAAYYKPDPGLPTLMGVSDRYEFENAMLSYKTGDGSCRFGCCLPESGGSPAAVRVSIRCFLVPCPGVAEIE